MNKPSYKLFGAAVFSVAVLLSAHAQTVTPDIGPKPDQPTGLLGKSYGAIDARVGKTRHASSSPTLWGPEVAINQPLADGLDFNAAYDYTRGDSAALRTRTNAFDAGLTAYHHLTGWTPFVAGDVGYAWNRSRVNRIDSKRNSGFYNLSAGVEVPIFTGLSLRPQVGYSENLKRPHGHGWSYGLDANYWLTRQLALHAGVALNDGKSGVPDSWLYTAGVRFGF